MKISLILGHPNKDSFNHAIAQRAAQTVKYNGHAVVFHDLYEERFDPMLTLQELSKNAALDKMIRLHCSEIADADGIIIVHPNWWGQPPAILKGWIDRVLRPGVAYEFVEGDSGEGVPRGLLKAGSAIVFNTSNTLSDREQAVFGDPLETIWKNCIFKLCGITNVTRRTFSVMVTSTPAQREAWLDEVGALVNLYYPAAAS